MKNTITMSRNHMTRALSITLILGLLLSSLALNANAAKLSKFYDGVNEHEALAVLGSWQDDAVPDITWYDEDDTEYSIGTAEELAGLAYLVNIGIDDVPVDFAGKKIKLIDDISLAERYWVPIGLGDNNADDNDAPTNVFKGSFDGQNYSISGFDISGFGEENERFKYFGLFGKIDATENDVSIQNINLIPHNEYCITAGNLADDTFIGGIVGYIKGSGGHSAIINNCNNYSQITILVQQGDIDFTVGGICGYAENTIITNCGKIAGGSVSSYLGDTATCTITLGGIAGEILESNIVNCSHFMYVDRINYQGKSSESCQYIYDSFNEVTVGGITGKAANSTVRNCFNASTFYYRNAACTGGIVGSDNGGTNIINSFYMNELQTRDTYYMLFNSGIGNQNQDAGSTPMSLVDMKDDSSYGSLSDKLNNEILNIDPANIGNVTLFRWQQGGIKNAGLPYLYNSNAAFSLRLDADANDPNTILIKNKGDLALLANQVNSGTNNFEGMTIKLTNDIDLDNCEWTPIGTYNNPFKGTFDGQNHFINNMNIGKNAGNALESNEAGLFGCVENATIKSVNIGGSSHINVDSLYDDYNSTYAGGICGYAKSSEIFDCSSNASIYSRHCAGGICGYADIRSEIYDCSNSGTIIAGSIAGGICGKLLCEIRDCENSGNIGAYEYAGGICGYADAKISILNCNNIGGNIKAVLSGNICGYSRYNITIQ